MNYYRSNGKFLLTGEYLVLKGATALALPLKFGQSLEVETLDTNENLIYWNAFLKSTDIVHSRRNWFSVILNKDDFSVIKTDDKEKAERLSNILSKAKLLNDKIFTDSHDYNFSTYLDFDPQWGLGSSSTLINNVSEWAEINPYLLLDSTFKGSGYDIACAKAETPIFYKLNNQPTADNGRIIEIANFNPEFKNNLYFVYQGHKQNSSNEVKTFLAKEKSFKTEINAISEISKILPEVQTLSDFCYFLKVHEEIMATCLEQNRIKKYFSDFEGEIKSLGAWGGDFFMAATSWDETKVRKYFESKDLNVIFNYTDIVYSKELV